MNSLGIGSVTLDQYVSLDSAACRDLLPHRDVMAMIDGVSWYRPAQRHLKAFKRVATNEFSVRGYCPRQPMFPPTLVIECLAQACGIMMNMERMCEESKVDPIRLDDPGYRLTLPPIPLSVLADSTIKQHARVYPGDTIDLDVRIVMQRHEFRYFKVSASVDDLQVADGTILLSYPTYLD